MFQKVYNALLEGKIDQIFTDNPSESELLIVSRFLGAYFLNFPLYVLPKQHSAKQMAALNEWTSALNDESTVLWVDRTMIAKNVPDYVTPKLIILILLALRQDSEALWVADRIESVQSCMAVHYFVNGNVDSIVERRFIMRYFTLLECVEGDAEKSVQLQRRIGCRLTKFLRCLDFYTDSNSSHVFVQMLHGYLRTKVDELDPLVPASVDLPRSPPITLPNNTVLTDPEGMKENVKMVEIWCLIDSLLTSIHQLNSLSIQWFCISSNLLTILPGFLSPADPKFEFISEELLSLLDNHYWWPCSTITTTNDENEEQDWGKEECDCLDCSLPLEGIIATLLRLSLRDRFSSVYRQNQDSQQLLDPVAASLIPLSPKTFADRYEQLVRDRENVAGQQGQAKLSKDHQAQRDSFGSSDGEDEIWKNDGDEADETESLSLPLQTPIISFIKNCCMDDLQVLFLILRYIKDKFDIGPPPKKSAEVNQYYIRNVSINNNNRNKTILSFPQCFCECSKSFWTNYYYHNDSSSEDNDGDGKVGRIRAGNDRRDHHDHSWLSDFIINNNNNSSSENSVVHIQLKQMSDQSLAAIHAILTKTDIYELCCTTTDETGVGDPMMSDPFSSHPNGNSRPFVVRLDVRFNVRDFRLICADESDRPRILTPVPPPAVDLISRDDGYHQNKNKSLTTPIQKPAATGGQQITFPNHNNDNNNDSKISAILPPIGNVRNLRRPESSAENRRKFGGKTSEPVNVFFEDEGDDGASSPFPESLIQQAQQFLTLHHVDDEDRKNDKKHSYDDRFSRFKHNPKKKNIGDLETIPGTVDPQGRYIDNLEMMTDEIMSPATTTVEDSDNNEIVNHHHRRLLHPKLNRLSLTTTQTTEENSNITTKEDGGGHNSLDNNNSTTTWSLDTDAEDGDDVDEPVRKMFGRLFSRTTQQHEPNNNNNKLVPLLRLRGGKDGEDEGEISSKNDDDDEDGKSTDSDVESLPFDDIDDIGSDPRRSKPMMMLKKKRRQKRMPLLRLSAADLMGQERPQSIDTASRGSKPATDLHVCHRPCQEDNLYALRQKKVSDAETQVDLRKTKDAETGTNLMEDAKQYTKRELETSNSTAQLPEIVDLKPPSKWEYLYLTDLDQSFYAHFPLNPSQQFHVQTIQF